jgi:hypothetical protein
MSEGTPLLAAFCIAIAAFGFLELWTRRRGDDWWDESKRKRREEEDDE